MECPKDGTVLQPVEILGVTLDKCHVCDGLWCDYGEMKRLQRARQPEIEETIEARYGNPSVTKGTPTGHMRCPKCPEGKLQRYNYTYARPVQIDRCNLCSGVWLDQGELDAIVTEVSALHDVKNEAGLAAFFRKLGQLLG